MPFVFVCEGEERCPKQALDFAVFHVSITQATVARTLATVEMVVKGIASAPAVASSQEVSSYGTASTVMLNPFDFPQIEEGL